MVYRRSSKNRGRMFGNPFGHSQNNSLFPEQADKRTRYVSKPKFAIFDVQPGRACWLNKVPTQSLAVTYVRVPASGPLLGALLRLEYGPSQMLLFPRVVPRSGSSKPSFERRSWSVLFLDEGARGSEQLATGSSEEPPFPLLVRQRQRKIEPTAIRTASLGKQLPMS